MPNQEPQASNVQSGEGQVLDEPTVIPMEDPVATGTRTITADDANAGGTAQSQGASQAGQEQGVEYWKRVAQQNREDAEKFSEYSTIIRHLENNPNHVEVLHRGVEGHTIGIIAAENMAQDAQAQRQPSREEQLSAELGVEPSLNTEGTPQAPPRQAHQPTREELIKYGEAQARAKIEFNQFREDMASKGIPDHAIDEYVQYLRNPNAMSHYDLFVAHQNYKQRTAGSEGEGTGQPNQAQPQTQPPVVGAPISVTSMPAGATDRPESTAYIGEVDGMKFVQDPQNI